MQSHVLGMTEVVLPQSRFPSGVAVGLTSMPNGAQIYRIYLVMPSRARRAGAKYSMFGCSCATIPGFQPRASPCAKRKEDTQEGQPHGSLGTQSPICTKLPPASLRREPCGYFTLSFKPWMRPGTQGRQLDRQMREVSDQIPRDIELTRALEKRCQRQGSERRQFAMPIRSNRKWEELRRLIVAAITPECQPLPKPLQQYCRK